MKWSSFVVAAALLLTHGVASSCGRETPCEVEGGRYLVSVPADWNGRAPLPTAVFFHGYRSSASAVLADSALVEAMSKLGVLLVAPNGRDGAWSIDGKLSSGRDDRAFVRAVLSDLAKRFPIDRSRLVATGFSAGGFLTWDLACNAGDLFSAYAPIAGAFLDPIPDACPSGPVSIRHVHGVADAVVPMHGRWIAGGRVKQSDVRASVARMVAQDGCRAPPARRSADFGMECEVWPASDCAGGREIELCLHASGHELQARWVVAAMQWAAALARRPPR